MSIKQQAKDILQEARDMAKSQDTDAAGKAMALIRIAELLLVAEGLIPYRPHSDRLGKD